MLDAHKQKYTSNASVFRDATGASLAAIHQILKSNLVDADDTLTTELSKGHHIYNAFTHVALTKTNPTLIRIVAQVCLSTAVGAAPAVVAPAAPNYLTCLVHT